MNTLLVVVQVPNSQKAVGLAGEYKALLDHPSTIPSPNSGVEKLAENVWLIPLDGGLHFLAGLLLELRHNRSLQYRILQLGKRWSWLDAKKQPTP